MFSVVFVGEPIRWVWMINRVGFMKSGRLARIQGQALPGLARVWQHLAAFGCASMGADCGSFQTSGC